MLIVWAPPQMLCCKAEAASFAQPHCADADRLLPRHNVNTGGFSLKLVNVMKANTQVGLSGGDG
jgi:hypothetical protein